MSEERVPPRLGQHALARVDQDDRKVGSGRAGHHIAGILFVAGRFRHDEFALFGGEKAIGDVDRDALFALCREAIDQKREVDPLPLRADPLAVRFQRGELVFKDHLAVIQQPPDQRRFAIVDRPAGDETQHRLVLMHIEIGIDVFRNQGVDHIDRFWRRHQKYPCCFFTSMPAPPASLSMARPCRSLVVVNSVS